MKLDYTLLDVFTRAPLSGNPLAVVQGADDVPDALMQRIANEFNLSETVFVQRPADPGHTARLRIFTPAIEMPFAGHPTIGAAVLLGLDGNVDEVRLEEGVGLVVAPVERRSGASGAARFALPQLPEPAGTIGARADIATALGIEADDIGCGALEPCVHSAGNLFHLVPVRDSRVLARITLNAPAWRDAFPHGRHSAYVFTAVSDEPGVDFAARKLTPGSHEDPGTGSAVAALIGLLAATAPFETGAASHVLRQGHEIGRPCRIALTFRKAAGRLVDAGIGGDAVIVGRGVLEPG